MEEANSRNNFQNPEIFGSSVRKDGWRCSRLWKRSPASSVCHVSRVHGHISTDQRCAESRTRGTRKGGKDAGRGGGETAIILLILGEDELSREQNSPRRDKQLPPLRRWHTNCFFNTDVFYTFPLLSLALSFSRGERRISYTILAQSFNCIHISCRVKVVRGSWKRSIGIERSACNHVGWVGRSWKERFGFERSILEFWNFRSFENSFSGSLELT